MNTKSILTVFTPAFNRVHTIGRTYESLLSQTCKDFEWLVIDDGSSDGTREWLLSLGEKVQEAGAAYDWMGRQLEETTLDHFTLNAEGLRIEYIRKPNGGLFTGYNVAFQTVQTELCVCIDSDDYAPEDLVENVKCVWDNLSADKRAGIGGIAGLDYNVLDKLPIGGFFSVDNQSAWIFDLDHKGDSKYVFRTDLMRRYCPQIGFEGEKDYNPHYMQMQLFDKYQMWIVNKNFCWVEYQIGADSMSQAIFKQYKRSPKSYARYRLMELSMTRGLNFFKKLSLCAHYVSACIFSRDSSWLRNSNDKGLVLLAVPLGVVYNIYIRYKACK
ncbi:Glycosyl transferase family 2 [Xylanibacter ruminicola]|uniref:Glycosyl transferase family 2 n=1 Tax=Xylanibacter ruminicola TaxID=839 RepID=A0A1H4DR94_XYLRU|nr:glycosyltransferase family A protein [Xylanibacter ruminicola]SEA75157.1 Glycosyl transferase family 2 [Xylanibacter ruminicola]